VDVRAAIRTLAEKLQDDEALLAAFQRDPVTIAVALASLKRIQATTMQYSEGRGEDEMGGDVEPTQRTTRGVLEQQKEQQQEEEGGAVSHLTHLDRIPERDRFRSYYLEARLMIGLVHPYSVRDVNRGRQGQGQGVDRVAHADFDGDADMEGYLDYPDHQE
jgi:hypothetical protein